MTRAEAVTAKAPVPSEWAYPPRLIYDEQREVVGVILAYGDYQTFLRLLAHHADWESLPGYLQDAIDNLLADEALKEDGPSTSLEDLLAEKQVP
jgi:hypothetical protein